MPSVSVSPYFDGTNYALGNVGVLFANSSAATAWSNARGASSGTVDQTTIQSPDSIEVSYVQGRGHQYTIHRSFLWYDLSALASSTSSNVISALTHNVPSGGTSGVSTDFVIAKSVNAFSSATTATLASGDFNSVYFTTYYSSTGLSWATTGLTVSTNLNTSAVNDANSNGLISMVYLNYSYDSLNSQPSTSFSFTGINSIDSRSPSKVALTVTYAAAGLSYDVNTVLGADIKEVNTVGNADIGELNTVS